MSRETPSTLPQAQRYRLLRVLEDRLLFFVLATTGLGLFAPGLGQMLEPAVSLLLALLIFAISLTFDVKAVQLALRRPSLLGCATFMVYVPMALAGFAIGRLFFAAGTLTSGSTLATGQTLVGTLPTDVSAPLLVLLAGGNVALAAVMNALNTAIAPFAVPGLLLLLTGESLHLPVLPLITELCLIILLPMAAGVWLRTRFPTTIARHEPLYTFSGSLLYLLLLLAVVGVNAASIWGYGAFALHILAAQLLLNLTGYALGFSVQAFISKPEDRTALLFTVSKKEFSIAAVLVFRAGLPPEMAVPAAFYAVLQMITSPLMVAILNRTRARRLTAN